MKLKHVFVLSAILSLGSACAADNKRVRFGGSQTRVISDDTSAQSTRLAPSNSMTKESWAQVVPHNSEILNRGMQGDLAAWSVVTSLASLWVVYNLDTVRAFFS